MLDKIQSKPKWNERKWIFCEVVLVELYNSNAVAFTFDCYTFLSFFFIVMFIVAVVVSVIGLSKWVGSFLRFLHRKMKCILQFRSNEFKYYTTTTEFKSFFLSIFPNTHNNTQCICMPFYRKPFLLLTTCEK